MFSMINFVGHLYQLHNHKQQALLLPVFTKYRWFVVRAGDLCCVFVAHWLPTTLKGEQFIIKLETNK